MLYRISEIANLENQAGVEIYGYYLLFSLEFMLPTLVLIVFWPNVNNMGASGDFFNRYSVLKKNPVLIQILQMVVYVFVYLRMRKLSLTGETVFVEMERTLPVP